MKNAKLCLNKISEIRELHNDFIENKGLNLIYNYLEHSQIQDIWNDAKRFRKSILSAKKHGDFYFNPSVNLFDTEKKESEYKYFKDLNLNQCLILSLLSYNYATYQEITANL